MYALAIVDDEEVIRKGLSSILNWKQLGFELSDCFTDGDEVIAYLETHHLDVLICDIRMKNVSGLEVAKYVYEHRLPTKIIFLTAYKDFDLIRQALLYKADDYILKPTNLNELKEKLQKARIELDRQSERERLREQIDGGVTKALNMIYHMLGAGRPGEDASPPMGSGFYFHGNSRLDIYLLRTENAERPEAVMDILLSAFCSDNDQSNVCIIPRQDWTYFLISWCDLENEEIDRYIADRIRMVNLSTALQINVISSKRAVPPEKPGNRNLRMDRRDLLDVVDTLIERRMAEKITLESISKEIYMNPSYFSRYFLRKKGVSFSDYLLEARVRRAKELLRSTGLLVYEICDRIGIKNYKHFHKVFRERVGVAPVVYRAGGQSAL